MRVSTFGMMIGLLLHVDHVLGSHLLRNEYLIFYAIGFQCPNGPSGLITKRKLFEKYRGWALSMRYQETLQTSLGFPHKTSPFDTTILAQQESKQMKKPRYF
ncbi:MAG: hypothetical protein P0S93_03895 [Candidatus Neptunochlamydia sp.]|nr:hypothetical protein [Candidatus Neptunochlamydia sp.]